MNTFWLKIAGIAVIVVVVVIAIASFTGKGEPKQPITTIYDQWKEDDDKLTAKPQFKELPAPQQPNQPTIKKVTVKPIEPVEPPKPQFKKLSLEDDIEAQRLWEWVLTQRKMGRLPVIQYKQMVNNCREIIRRWPESEYAFYAKRALADLPDRYKKMYNITDEETNLGNYK